MAAAAVAVPVDVCFNEASRICIETQGGVSQPVLSLAVSLKIPIASLIDTLKEFQNRYEGHDQKQTLPPSKVNAVVTATKDVVDSKPPSFLNVSVTSSSNKALAVAAVEAILPATAATTTTTAEESFHRPELHPVQRAIKKAGGASPIASTMSTDIPDVPAGFTRTRAAAEPPAVPPGLMSDGSFQAQEQPRDTTTTSARRGAALLQRSSTPHSPATPRNDAAELPAVAETHWKQAQMSNKAASWTLNDDACLRDFEPTPIDPPHYGRPGQRVRAPRPGNFDSRTIPEAPSISIVSGGSPDVKIASGVGVPTSSGTALDTANLQQCHQQ